MGVDAFGNYVCILDTFPSPDTSVTLPGALVTSQLACGHGPPQHTPIIPIQEYQDVDSGTVYWYSPTNGWQPPVP